MSMPRTQFVVTLTILVSMLFVLAPEPTYVEAASHREAPLISKDPTADITDFFMFRSYEPGKEDKIVFIMDVIPGEEPGFGPNYYNFDPHVLYKIDIDNDGNGDADDVSFEFRFETEIRGTVDELDLFLGYVALPAPITALDGPGSEGLGLRQKYSVVMKRNDRQYNKLADDLIVVPSNAGPRTMPEYAALAQQGVYDIDNGVRVFAGQRQDPFYIDVGAIFDTLNLRRTPPVLTAAEDAQGDTNPFGVDMLSGFNVHTIAIEVPASLLTQDGLGPEETSFPRLGAFASTSRQRVRVLATPGGRVQAAGADSVAASPEEEAINQALDQALDEVLSDEEAAEQAGPDQTTGEFEAYIPYAENSEGTQADAAQADAAAARNDEGEPCRIGTRHLICNRGKYIQVQRLANPLINETIIPTELKDRWGTLEPIHEHRFEEYYLNPRLAVALETVFGVPAATSNREDLVAALLQYPNGEGQLADLLRLDISVPPTPLAAQGRLGPFSIDVSGNPAPDPAGWPNGRRPNDDVTDIAVRVVGGPNYIEARAGDGVNTDDANLLEGFPFLATPADGLNHVHDHNANDNNSNP